MSMDVDPARVGMLYVRLHDNRLQQRVCFAARR